ncbi:Transcriptional regulator, TetR family [Salipiger mucosus DSM 16094]|uniref:Transcriptional regulator, TetR family n=2 Tax=Salipiger mucosus TaxID=263378 RepID=S9S5D7_9RHOB|nr:Transcriptional regulator, TetR family [Salipiger mucosus DSM 16094]
MGGPNMEKGKRELAAEARRKLLMEAAITCFAESGIARTSMRDIARKAGVSIGNLYNHFPGRDDLIAEIAKMETAGLTGIVEAVKACGESGAAVETFVMRYFDHCAEPVSAVLTIEITSEALRNPEIGRLFSGNRSMLIAYLAEAMALERPEPTRAEEERHLQTAGLILDTVEGFALRVGLGGKPATDADKLALMAFIDRAVNGDVP